MKRTVSDPTQLSTKPDDGGDPEDFTTFFYNYLGQRIDSHGHRISDETRRLAPLCDQVGPVAAAAAARILPTVAQTRFPAEDFRTTAQNLVSHKSGRVNGDSLSERGAPGPCPTDFMNFRTQKHSRVRNLDHNNAPASAFGPTVKSEVKTEVFKGKMRGNKTKPKVANNWALSMVVGLSRRNILGQRNPATRFYLNMRAVI